MAGQPKRRAREAAAAAGAADETGSRPRGAPRSRPDVKAKRKPPEQRSTRGKHGPKRPRFEPASPDDFARVEAGIARAAQFAAQAKAARTPAEREAALTDAGLRPTGRAADDKKLLVSVARVRRDEGIIAAAGLSLTVPAIAAQFGLTETWVRQIIQAHRERRSSVAIPSSSELLDDCLEALDLQLERCSLIASAADNDAVKVGAIRTWLEIEKSKVELLVAMNRISPVPSSDARNARVRDVLRVMLDKLRAKGVQQDVIDQVAAEVLNVVGDNVVVIEARARSLDRDE